MPFDITGGLDPGFDYLLGERPEEPLMRDCVSMWISDSAGRFGFPRVAVEAVGEVWGNSGLQVNIAFPDGRVLKSAGGFPVAPPKVVDGKTVTINAGPLTFEVKEPLRHWTMRFDGEAYETTVAAQYEGVRTGSSKHVVIEVDAKMAVPPWTPGAGAATVGDQATALAVGAIGGHRHEQLFHCTGRFMLENEAERTFAGTGLRIRRTGVRIVGEFPGHCWMSALFPSGKAFGILAFPPRSDGTPAYSEAFVFDGGAVRYGKVVEAPWLKRFEPHGGRCDIGIALDDRGTVAIAGRTHCTTFAPPRTPMFGSWAYTADSGGMNIPFAQGDALYTWDGEQAFGMTERSLPFTQWTDQEQSA